MALVFDKDFYKFLIEKQELVSLRDETVLLHIIDKSLELKSQVVEIFPRLHARYAFERFVARVCRRDLFEHSRFVFGQYFAILFA